MEQLDIIFLIVRDVEEEVIQQIKKLLKYLLDLEGFAGPVHYI